MVESLPAAARPAVANGAPDSAAAYLRRALAEPPPERLRPACSSSLGSRVLRRRPAGSGSPKAALETTADATAQVSITLALGRMLQIEGRNREALEVFDQTRGRLHAAERQATLTLEGASLGAAQLDATTADDAAPRIAHLRRPAEQQPTFHRACSAR